jgi:ketosteroid isomerase-like protein
MGKLIWPWEDYRGIWEREAAVRKSIEDMERELREAGHEVEREYEMGKALDTYDGDGWVVRVDGKAVASAASLGGLEEGLGQWLGTGAK